MNWSNEIVVHQRSIPSWVNRYLVIIASLFVVASVTPEAFNRILYTPLVHGKIIDLDTLQPIEGVNIQHHLKDKKFAVGELSANKIQTKTVSITFLPPH